MRFLPSTLRGTIRAPESKSLWHRELIAGALSGAFPIPTDPCDDVLATQGALTALLAGENAVNCRESGATLRFLLPLAAALGRVGTEFLCAPSLRRRPLPFPAEQTAQGWRVTFALQGGVYSPNAHQTSQVVSGLLMSLPLLSDNSDIMLTSTPVSGGYIAMTVEVLRRHSIEIIPTAQGFHIPGNQKYAAAAPLVEGDWSAAAWYTLFCPEVTVENLAIPSWQPDSAALNYVNRSPSEIDISGTPDLLPSLALKAALTPGQTTVFTHGAFLRGKESDRLHTVAAAICALGGEALETADGLVVSGRSSLSGGSVDACGDHRIALLGAFSSLFCDGPVSISDISCISKSYPQFMRDFAQLGGKVEDDSL